MISEVEAPPEPSPPDASRPIVWLRRSGMAVLVVSLVIGLANLLDVSQAEATASGGGMEATVTYAVVARRGETVPLLITVSGIDGTEEPVTVWLRESFLDDLELYGWSPEPSATIAATGEVGLRFPALTGDLNVELDARLLPTTTIGNHEYSVIIETEVGELELVLTTLVFP